MGKDFWVMFLTNHLDTEEYSLIATCNRACTIRVNNPSTQWDTTVCLTAAGSIRINIPPTSATTATDEVSGGGIHVTSSHQTSLYASNYVHGSFDIATIYPTATLGTRYMAQTYDESGSEEVGFVAVENFTRLNMMTSSGLRSVTLMRGESYQIAGYGHSGMVVTSNGKPFAMFQGNTCTNVGYYRYCDHLYEQCIPNGFWGNQFMLVSTATRDMGDLVQIISLEDSCQIYLNDTMLTTLQSGNTFLYNLPPDTEGLLHGTKPISVYLYLKSQECGNSNGDPASVVIPPLEQGVSSAIFEAINTRLTTEHYVNIVTPNIAVPFMRLDGLPIDTGFTTTPDGYAHARLSVTPGTHTLNCDSGKFVSWFYGLGHAESYAYVTGHTILSSPEQLYVDGLNASTYMGSFDYCQGDTVSIWVERDGDELHTVWLIDSVPLNIDTNRFQYLFDAGDHLVEAVVNTCDTLSAIIHVHPPRVYSVIRDTGCFEPYYWMGMRLDSSGVYHDTLPNLYGCDTFLTLELTIIQRPEIAITGSIDCHNGNYRLTVDPQGIPFSWSSTPHDTQLDGHEHDTIVYVTPPDSTIYTIDIDYVCPFSDTVTLSPIVSPAAAWVINPELLTYEHPRLDAYDKSQNAISRQWIVNQQLQDETGSHLNHYASFDDDSVEVMLVVGSGTCLDTLRRIIPFSHAAQWAPNIFTPGAESNNLFSVVLNECVAEELCVYNREGVLVRRMDGPAPVWDGKSDGKLCPQGGYVWLLRYHTDANPEVQLTMIGTVTIIR